MPERTSYVSVDVLALRYAPESASILLGVHRRPAAPFAGRLALPGVLLLRGERLRSAGGRALTKLGLTDGSTVRDQGQLVTFDEPNRDPRGPTLSVALWAVLDPAMSALGTADWFPLDAVPRLAFDHNRIVQDCMPLLADLLWRHLGFSRALTGPAFTAADALAITAALTGSRPDRGNLNRTLAALPGLVRTDERRLGARGTGRPGVVWTWS